MKKSLSKIFAFLMCFTVLKFTAIAAEQHTLDAGIGLTSCNGSSNYIRLEKRLTPEKLHLFAAK